MIKLLFLGIMLQAGLPVVDTIGQASVTAVRNEVIVPRQSMSGSELQALSTSTVADALKFFSGVQIKDYGGLGGQKTINVRSLGTQHTGVYIDGIRITNCQNGTVDLGKYSLANMESVELFNANKMTQGDDNHTWTKKLSVTEANKGWDGTIGFIIPTGTSYSAKVFNLDKNNPGHVVLLSSDQTYVYIPVETGDWILTLNDKTLEYTLTSQSSATDELTALIQWLEDPENDPNEYEYTEETLAAYNQALAAAKEAVQSGDYDTVTAAMATLREKYYALQTKGGSSTLPDLPGNM